MRRGLSRTVTALALAVTLGGCGGAPDLLTVRPSQDGPEEFAVLPNKPLSRPENLAALPPPTLGGPNRSDPTPASDAIVALGGRPGAGAPATALAAYAGRFGTEPGVRTALAAEDLAFRRANDGRLLERIFDTNVYFRAYRAQSLDQYPALEAYRRAGIRTPAAPPEERR